MSEAAPAASLPMYDWPEVRWAHDALWSAIAERLMERGLAAPERLDRTRAAEDVWRDPGLVLSQTCGWPYATRLRGAVRLVGTPVYDVEGCAGPFYSSRIVARRRGGPPALAACGEVRFAFNAADSLSGYVGLVESMRAAGLDPGAAAWVETGSHRQSVRAVAAGLADVAAIDPVCWALAARFESEAAGTLETIGETRPRPALPLITGADRAEAYVEGLRSAVAEALSGRAAEACRALRLVAVAMPDEAAYAALAG